jgi:hypothetical protein
MIALIVLLAVAAFVLLVVARTQFASSRRHVPA